MKWLKLTLCFALMALLTSCTMRAEDYRVKDLKKLAEKTYDVKPGQKLTADLAVGDVVIKTWNKDECLIKIYGNSKAEDKLRFYYDKTGNGVKVKCEKEGSWLNNIFGSNINVRFEITVPQKFDLDIKTSGGDVNVEYLKGYIDIHTSGGDLTLKDIDGEVKMTTSGGDINLSGIKGNLDIETSGGDITAKSIYGDLRGHTSGGDIDVEVKEGRVNLETSGGDITFRYDGENKGIQLNTSGGDIHVYVPSRIKANAYFYTSGGDLSHPYKTDESKKRSSHKFSGDINGGGPKFTVETSGGDITIKER